MLIQNFAREIGIDIDYEVADWNTVINIWRAGAKDPSAKGASAINFSYSLQEPFSAYIRHLQCDLVPPTGTNWGYYCDTPMAALFDKVRNTFDPAQQTAVLRTIQEKFTNDALFLMVAHDVQARALSRKVHGFIEAQNWFQDFSPITVSANVGQ